MSDKNIYDLIKVDRQQIDNGPLKFKDYFSTPPMFYTKDLATVPYINRFNGGHAFLIAGGPSFKNVDKRLLAQPGVLTLGINNSPASFRPNMWVCVDSPHNFLASIWMDPTIEKIVPISHIGKKLFDSSKWKDMNVKVGDCPNVVYYRRNGALNLDEYPFEDTVNWGNHSDIGGGRSVFMAAMRILYLMGVRNLYLLGVDFHMDANTKYHFEQEREQGSINGNNSTYSSMKKWMTNIKPTFDELGFKVYNCNPDSALKAFPFMSVEDAVKAATKTMPSVTEEKTHGMYDRIANLEKDQKVVEAKKIAAKYNDEDRQKAKEAIDAARSALDDAKQVQVDYIVELYPDHPDEAYKWGHKLKCPEDPEMAQLYTDLKTWIKAEMPPEEQEQLGLYKTQIDVNNARAAFKKAEKEKNRIWGIVKK